MSEAAGGEEVQFLGRSSDVPESAAIAVKNTELERYGRL